jgi:F-type H+-transporting ATPase subunit b
MKVHLVQPLIGFDWTIVMVAITFFVLYLILKRFLFDKVHGFMQAREQKIIDSFDNAAEANRVADDRLTEYNAKVANIAAERRDLLTDARQKADESAKEIVKQAEERAARIVRQAEERIKSEQERAMVDMREQIAMLVMYAAEKVIEQKLDTDEQRAIVDGILEEADGQAWKI